MKKKTIVKIVILLLCLAVIVGTVLFFYEQNREIRERAQQEILKIDYAHQNRALPLVSGFSRWEEAYVGYESVDKEELYVRLAAYNERMRLNGEEEQELTLADVEEYLSSEYNEDGGLRIYEGYENIRRYVDWYYEEEGDEDIAEYWNALTDLIIEYKGQNPELVLCDPEEMNLAQLQELINKKNDATYEINMEVMKE